MATIKNSLIEKKEPVSKKFSIAITQERFLNLINSTLRDPARANRFIASISSAVATNPALQECDAGSIISAALLGEALNLSPSPQLGQFYMVPYKKKDRNGNVISVTAQFQLGYKGYLQLAIRSGQYKKINVLDIKEGELVNFDPLNEVIDAIIIDDVVAREQAETVGYYAMFEYLNGFRKVLYWSKDKMISHADQFSQAYSADKHKLLVEGKIHKDDMRKHSSFWYKNFDDMAFKTMLRQLISKWGIMSTEMQKAYESDMATLHEDGSREYIDSAESNDAKELPAGTDQAPIELAQDFDSADELLGPPLPWDDQLDPLG